jgi:hypothetical protein
MDVMEDEEVVGNAGSECESASSEYKTEYGNCDNTET